MRFIASLDTRIYGVTYLQGQVVDTTGWARKQLLQYLNTGIIAPADLNAESIGEVTLAALGDVSDTAADTGNFLKWDGTQWVPGSVALPPSTLDALTDVDTSTTAPADKQALVWDSATSLWKPGTVAAAGGGSGGPAPLPVFPLYVTSTWAYVNNVASMAMTIPAVAQPGDLMLVLGAHGYAFSGGTDWSQVDRQDGPNFNGAVYQRTIKAGEPGTTTTLTFAGAYYGLLSIVVVRNAKVGIAASARSSGATSPITLPTVSAPNKALLLHFGAIRGNLAVAVSRGLVRQSSFASEASGVLSTEILSAASTAAQATFSWEGTSFASYGVTLVLRPLDAAPVVVDDFDDWTLDAAWGRVDKAGRAGIVTWSEAAGALTALNAGNDTASELHAMMRPLASIGGPMQVGDAFVTCMTILAGRTDNAIGGLVLADGITAGAGTQVWAMCWANSSAGVLNNAIYDTSGYQANVLPNTNTTTNMMRVFQRLVKTGANAWRIDLSIDGLSWLSGLSTSTRVVTPTHVGLSSSSWSSSTKSVIAYELLSRVSGIA